MNNSIVPKWQRLNSAIGHSPMPKHGHRAVSVRDMMIIFGGDNDFIVNELHVFRTSNYYFRICLFLQFIIYLLLIIFFIYSYTSMVYNFDEW